MNTYTVVHSTDPWLLARLCMDLQMEGMKAIVPREWNDPWDSMFEKKPTRDTERRNMELCIYGNKMTFYGEKCGHKYPLTLHTLISTNYNNILCQILSNS